MLYCKACRHLSETEESKCPFCEKEDMKAPCETDSVFLVNIDPEDFGLLEKNLNESDIKFFYEDDAAPRVQSPYDGSAFLKKRDIFVNFEDYDKANEILNNTFEEVKKADEMPAPKSLAIQVISIILFIALISIVVFGADFLADLIKSFFS